MYRLSIHTFLFKVRQLIFFSLLPAALLLTLSCTSQKRLVKQAVLGFNPPAIILMYPEFIFKKNSNTRLIKGFDKMDKDQQDSALYYSSKYIQYIRDSIYLSVYIPSLIEELNQYGFKVYAENQLDTFLTIKEPAYVISIAQVEVDENVDPVVEEDVFDDTLSYYKNFDLKIVRLNTWIELSRMNAEKGKPKVLFSSFFVEDQLNGRFRRHPLLMDVKYKYLLNEVRLEDVFGLADYAGKKNASYLFDYLFNTYYREQHPDSLATQRYWHYNKLTNELRDAGDNRLINLE